MGGREKDGRDGGSEGDRRMGGRGVREGGMRKGDRWMEGGTLDPSTCITGWYCVPAEKPFRAWLSARPCHRS